MKAARATWVVVLGFLLSSMIGLGGAAAFADDSDAGGDDADDSSPGASGQSNFVIQGRAVDPLTNSGVAGAALEVTNSDGSPFTPASATYADRTGGFSLTVTLPAGESPASLGLGVAAAQLGYDTSYFFGISNSSSEQTITDLAVPLLPVALVEEMASLLGIVLDQTDYSIVTGSV